jgi:hypothetical protein
MMAITTSNSIKVKPAGARLPTITARVPRVCLLFSIILVIAGPVAGAGN